MSFVGSVWPVCPESSQAASTPHREQPGDPALSLLSPGFSEEDRPGATAALETGEDPGTVPGQGRPPRRGTHGGGGGGQQGTRRFHISLDRISTVVSQEGQRTATHGPHSARRGLCGRAVHAERRKLLRRRPRPRQPRDAPPLTRTPGALRAAARPAPTCPAGAPCVSTWRTVATCTRSLCSMY